MRVFDQRWPTCIIIEIEDRDFYRERSKKTGKVGGSLMPTKNRAHNPNGRGGKIVSPRQAHFRGLITKHCRGLEVGIEWLLPESVLTQPLVVEVRSTLVGVLAPLIFAAPFALYAKVWRSASGPMPLISLLLLLSNGVWWVILQSEGAFYLAAIFHGIQYLAIVIIFHVRDQVARPGNRHGTTYHAVRFYMMSLALGYVLFHCLPPGFVMAGFGPVESIVLVVAAINIHHFVVDAFIWRLKRSEGNRRIVEAGRRDPRSQLAPSEGIV